MCMARETCDFFAAFADVAAALRFGFFTVVASSSVPSSSSGSSSSSSNSYLLVFEEEEVFCYDSACVWICTALFYK